jgi:amphiphysin
MAHSFEDSTKDILEQLKPELDVIERRVIQPTADLLVLLESVKKVIVKRDHKLIDYDRYRNATQKLTERTDRDVGAEKKLGQNEIALEAATKEYNSVNNLLKQQLPILLLLKTSFIDPCFQTLYWYHYYFLLREITVS